MVALTCTLSGILPACYRFQTTWCAGHSESTQDRGKRNTTVQNLITASPSPTATANADPAKEVKKYIIQVQSDLAPSTMV